MSDLKKDLMTLSVGEINKRLRDYGCTNIEKIKSKERKVDFLEAFILREKNHPLNATFDIGDLVKELEERRLAFIVPENSQWRHIYGLKKKDVPKSFNRARITIFLKDAKFKINGTFVNNSTEKPKQKGWRLYMSKKVISCKFLKTATMLLLDAHVERSFVQERR